jgi:hypothetical protein
VGTPTNEADWRALAEARAHQIAFLTQQLNDAAAAFAADQKGMLNSGSSGDGGSFTDGFLATPDKANLR